VDPVSVSYAGSFNQVSVRENPILPRRTPHPAGKPSTALGS
jgi:hypothetical protein